MEFVRHSELPKEKRNSSNYIKIKRLILRMTSSYDFEYLLNYDKGPRISPFTYVLSYYDLEKESQICFWNNYTKSRRTDLDAFTDFYTSLYEGDLSLFRSFFGLLLKESQKRGHIEDEQIIYLKDELTALGFIYDGNILRNIGGNPEIDQRIISKLETDLKNLDPKLLEMRAGALEALLSNRPDKNRHVASSCRALINTTLSTLVPQKFKENEIRQRLTILFEKVGNNSVSALEFVDATTKFYQSLTSMLANGDHKTIDDSMVYFVFEFTEKLLMLLLYFKK